MLEKENNKGFSESVEIGRPQCAFPFKGLKVGRFDGTCHDQSFKAAGYNPTFQLEVYVPVSVIWRPPELPGEPGSTFRPQAAVTQLSLFVISLILGTNRPLETFDECCSKRYSWYSFLQP